MITPNTIFSKQINFFEISKFQELVEILSISKVLRFNEKLYSITSFSLILNKLRFIGALVDFYMKLSKVCSRYKHSIKEIGILNFR